MKQKQKQITRPEATVTVDGRRYRVRPVGDGHQIYALSGAAAPGAPLPPATRRAVVDAYNAATESDAFDEGEHVLRVVSASPMMVEVECTCGEWEQDLTSRPGAETLLTRAMLAHGVHARAAGGQR